MGISFLVSSCQNAGQRNGPGAPVRHHAAFSVEASLVRACFKQSLFSLCLQSMSSWKKLDPKDPSITPGLWIGFGKTPESIGHLPHETFPISELKNLLDKLEKESGSESGTGSGSQAIQTEVAGNGNPSSQKEKGTGSGNQPIQKSCMVSGSDVSASSYSYLNSLD